MDVINVDKEMMANVDVYGLLKKLLQLMTSDNENSLDVRMTNNDD